MELHAFLGEARALGISGVGACCTKSVTLWLSTGFRGMKPVTPLRARTHCGVKALAPLRGKIAELRRVSTRTGARGFNEG